MAHGWMCQVLEGRSSSLLGTTLMLKLRLLSNEHLGYDLQPGKVSHDVDKGSGWYVAAVATTELTNLRFASKFVHSRQALNTILSRTPSRRFLKQCQHCRPPALALLTYRCQPRKHRGKSGGPSATIFILRRQMAGKIMQPCSDG